MSAVELRNRIITKISAIEDEGIPEEIYNLIKIESEIDPLYKLTDSEEKAIETGLKDIENGKVFSSEKANELIKEWLKK